MITLGIDYGASNIGIALVLATEAGENIPLFAGTLRVDTRHLKEKVETRAGIRRLRRTRKTKKRRLRNLHHALESLGLSPDETSKIIRFSKRRGYKSLFDEDSPDETNDDSELTYRFTREEFFKSLEKELSEWISDEARRTKALSICEKILNRHGNRDHEVRKLRIDNRGVSRCAWEGCRAVTPRLENALKEALSQQIYTVFQTPVRDNTVTRNEIDEALANLTELAKRLRNASGDDPNSEKKILRKKARSLLRHLRDRFFELDEAGLEKDKAWKYIESSLMNILENRGGRNRYCRFHSKEYVNTILQGKPVPFKKTIADSDIISRREQIAYAKIWRYIEARLLPLAPDGIDRIVVERTAFDLLAGSWKSITDATDAFKEDMYQQGPMYGFSSTGEMLREEFGGLCAYCGLPSSVLMDRDHILPRADFFFDSYLNIVPACPKCNSALKGRRPASEIAMTIHPDAYNAYDHYLRSKFKKRPMHFFHSIKKGILNLMKDPDRLWEAERYLSLITKQFSQIVQTQRSPRPFARYLSSKIGTLQGKTPEIRFKNGRHTALYRNVAYPEFDKYREKEEGNAINHALDAMLLASQLPDLYPVESLNIPLSSLKAWSASVKRKAPKPSADGIPSIQNLDRFVDGFEVVHGGGYIDVELRTMVWNQRDTMTHKQDPYGLSPKDKRPTKRKSALNLYNELKKEKSEKLKNKILLIHHPSLRKTVMDAVSSEGSGEKAAEALKSWLRDSVKNSLGDSNFSNHPGDQARKEALERFANSLTELIPDVIGVKNFDTGAWGRIDLERFDKQTGYIGQRYVTQPTNRGVVVAYPKKKEGSADLSRPCCLYLKQNCSVVPEELAVFKTLPEKLAKGRIFGSNDKKVSHLYQEIEHYLKDCGFFSYVLLTPGCVITYADGGSWFVRNFDKNEDFKKARLRNIVALRKNPFSQKSIPQKILT